ncbi:hypothetical protein HWV62_5417 [Athelia sp. TMB]|nr:hypothetical protein HWV62_5417 [Athelia sp. TMB]
MNGPVKPHSSASGSKKPAQSFSAGKGKKRPDPFSSLKSTTPEYQTSAKLYEALVAKSYAPITFSGCYAIVSTAIPAVTVSRRAALVSRELRDVLESCRIHSFEYV